jgi:predicted amidohydrolase YtcJ
MVDVDPLKADLALINGKIVTVDVEGTIVEAVAMRDGRIIHTGSTEEVRMLVGDRTRVINLEGRTVLPGIIDSHTHPSHLASRLLEVDCRSPPVRSITEILGMVRQKAAELGPGRWVRGANFNDSKLEERRHITRRELDEAAPDNPVHIVSDTGHQCLVNSAALRVAGVTRETHDPPGGEIERDEDGEATGLIYETVQALVSRAIPPYTFDEVRESYRRVIDQFAEWGVTSTHDASGHRTGIRAFKQLLDEGVRKLRVSLMVSARPQHPEGADILGSMVDLGIESGFGDDWLKVISLKIMGDGSGAGGTAAVYTPQGRGPKGLGFMMTDTGEIEEMTISAHDASIRVSIHSIGDRGIDVALDCIEKAQSLNPRPDMRHRLEHNSCCTPRQLRRIRELGVAPSSSVGYMYGLGDMYAENFGPERSRWLHPHRTMLEMGIIAGGNNDCPVTFYGPFVQIYSAVTRKTASGRVVGPEEAIGVMDAIRVYTWNGAYLAKDEDRLGSIEPGKLADMIVLDRDVLTVPHEEIKEIKVLKTIVDGKIVYERE